MGKTQAQPAVPRHDPDARVGRLPERRRLRDAVFDTVAAILGDDEGRFVALAMVPQLFYLGSLERGHVCSGSPSHR